MDGMIELEKKYTKKVNYFEAVQIFKDEFMDIYNQKRRDCNSQHKPFKELKKIVNREIFIDSEAQEIIDQIYINELCFCFETDEDMKQMKKAKRVWDGLYNPKKKDLSTIPVEQAKLIPIESLIALEKEKKSAYRVSGCCPFPDHEDNSPSFIINTHNNTYKCFGCQKGGDAIQFVRDLYGKNFVEAVKFLNNQGG